MFTIQQRDVPEQLVLTEQRHVKAAELPDWIRAAGRPPDDGRGRTRRHHRPCLHRLSRSRQRRQREPRRSVRANPQRAGQRRRCGDAPRARPSRGLRQNHKSSGPVPGDPAGLSGPSPTISNRSTSRRRIRRARCTSRTSTRPGRATRSATSPSRFGDHDGHASARNAVDARGRVPDHRRVRAPVAPLDEGAAALRPAGSC